jgi:predicted tellurium resistance membrane protein TerC
MVRFYAIVNGTFGGFLRAQLLQGLIYGLATALVMTAFCVGLFVYLLQLPFQLWPWI